MTIEDLVFSSSPFWVQVHGLPLGQMNRKNGEAIANLIGKPDPSGTKVYDTATFKDYLRLRVIIDITKPLKKGFFLKRRDKEDLWIKFKYERLSDFCYVCGLIGHGLNDCMEKSVGVRSHLEFGSYLRAEVSIIETINPGKPVQTISNSSSEDFVAVDSPLVKAARVVEETTASEGTTSDQDGTVLVRKDKTVIPCDEPAGILTSRDATFLPSNPKSCSSKDKGISPPPFVLFTDFNSVPLNPTFSISRLDLTHNLSPSGPNYFVEEPPDSPGRNSPLSPLGPPVQNRPLLEAPSDISPLIKTSHIDPNLATKSLLSPNPSSTVGLSSIFDKLLCLKRKSPPSSPSHISPPLKLHKPAQPVEASSSPAPIIPSVTPEDFEAFIQPGILSLAQPVGDSGKARKSAARRASSFKRKGILNEVPIVPSFQHNQQDLLGFSIEVTPIATGDEISPMEACVSPSDSRALVAGPKQPHEKC